MVCTQWKNYRYNINLICQYQYGIYCQKENETLFVLRRNIYTYTAFSLFLFLRTYIPLPLHIPRHFHSCMLLGRKCFSKRLTYVVLSIYIFFLLDFKLKIEFTCEPNNTVKVKSRKETRKVCTVGT